MSPASVGIYALIACAVVAVAVAVFRMRQTPVIERDEEELLPLFSGAGVENLPGEADEATGFVADESAVAEPVRASEPPVERVSRNGATPAAAGTVGPSNGVRAGTPSPARAPYAPPEPGPSIRTFTTARPSVVNGSNTERQPFAPASSPPIGGGAQPLPTHAAAALGVSVEHTLIQFSLPNEGTLQFLPGRLEIASGHDIGREIRFVRLPGPDGTEFTFGRSEGQLYRHIQLRDQTVSRIHARMRFHEGRWYLKSLSQTNPVMHDGNALAIGDEQLLDDGARIEMGEVFFTFRNR
jgi:hypothetical protein